MRTLRVCDFGRVSPRRSQTLWHAIAEGVSAGGPATLSFMRPSRPYVGIGYHRSAAEVDLDWCRTARLPVYRRKAGGGVVYLDAGQLFFQICLPASAVPARRDLALRRLLCPAVEAFRAAGVDASLDAAGEITVGPAKICGHGAAQIGDAVVVVGNVIERFDHWAAARVLALSPEARTEVGRLMQRYVRPTALDSRVFRQAAVAAYSATLDCTPGGFGVTRVGLSNPRDSKTAMGALDDVELGALARLDSRFASRGWLTGSAKDRPVPAARVTKIRAGVFVVSAEVAEARLVMAVVDSTVERATLAAPQWNGQARPLAASLTGLPVTEAVARLGSAPDPGTALAGALRAVRLAA